MTKLDYNNALEKHKVRNKAFSYINNNKIIGLGGPNINEYIDFLYNNGFNNITIYEQNRKTFIHQLNILKSKNITIINDNINSCVIDNTIFYDLDYCCRMDSLDLDWIHKIDNFLITVSYMYSTIDKSLALFFNNKSLNNNYSYKVFKYFDTSPMLSILKF